MNFTLVQTEIFWKRWKQFRLNDEDLQALEMLLLKRPEAGAVMAGTGGLRKIRFSPPSRHSGKSGAYRVTYALFPAARVILLVSIFAKADQANLTAAEKARFKTLLQSLSKQLG